MHGYRNSMTYNGDGAILGKDLGVGMPAMIDNTIPIDDEKIHTAIKGIRKIEL